MSEPGEQAAVTATERLLRLASTTFWLSVYQAAEGSRKTASSELASIDSRVSVSFSLLTASAASGSNDSPTRVAAAYKAVPSFVGTTLFAAACAITTNNNSQSGNSG